jgi:hypothetical protein
MTAQTKFEKLSQLIANARENEQSIALHEIMEIDPNIDYADLLSLLSSSYSDVFIAEVVLDSIVPLANVKDLYDLVDDITFELRRYDGLSEAERETYKPIRQKSEAKSTSGFSRFNRICKHPAKHRLIVDWQKYWDHFPTTEEIVIAATTGSIGGRGAAKK